MVTPIVVVPSSRFTAPVTLPPVPGWTVITKVTAWPYGAGFKLEVTVVVVEA